MKIALFPLLFVLGFSAFAADCPVTLGEIEKAWAPDDLQAFDIHVKNTSGKTIRAMKLDMIFFDATNDIYPDLDRGLWDGKIEEGKDQKIHFQSEQIFL